MLRVLLKDVIAKIIVKQLEVDYTWKSVETASCHESVQFLKIPVKYFEC